MKMNKLQLHDDQLSRLKSKVNRLKRMCQLTNLYLSNYFLDLKSQVDSEMAEQYLKQIDTSTKQSIQHIWLRMIDKIETFERECIQNKQLETKLPNANQIEIINSIEDKLSDPSNFDLNQLNLNIQAEEYGIEKSLFKNQTIFFVSKSNTRNLNHGKLLVINDEYVSSQGIQALKDMPMDNDKPKILTNELIKVHLIDKKLKQDNDIIEDSLDLSNLNLLDLSFKQIVSIGENCFWNLANLEKLYVTYNQISQLTEFTFRSLNTLVCLDLSDNIICLLHPKAFSGLDNLENLNLFRNKITHLDESSFYGLSKLKVLNLRLNEISILKENVFLGLDSLETLNLHRNKIVKINRKAFNGLTSLKMLNLTFNKLKSLLPMTFDGLDSLDSLDLHGNEIEEINQDVFKGLKNLKKLFLNRNRILRIDENAFSGLDNLIELCVWVETFFEVNKTSFVLNNLIQRGISVIRAHWCI